MTGITSHGIVVLLILVGLAGLFGIVCVTFFDVGGQSSPDPIVAAIAHRSGNLITITYYGCNCVAENQVAELVAVISGNITRIANPKVGSMLTGIAKGAAGQDHVSITVTYIDGMERTILDTFV